MLIVSKKPSGLIVAVHRLRELEETAGNLLKLGLPRYLGTHNPNLELLGCANEKAGYSTSFFRTLR